jgi:5-methylcytosine-specific restriction protein A
LILKPVTNSTESERAFNIFKEHFALGASEFPDHRVGFQGGGHNCDVFWHEKLGVWGLFDPSLEKGRYWICYGLQNPADNPMLTITVETNPPKEGVNRRCAGVFLQDGQGNFYIAHSGKVGGGRKGIGKAAFRAFAQNEEWKEVAWPNGKHAEYRVISRLDAPDLPERMAEFVHEVARFKESALSDTDITSTAFLYTWNPNRWDWVDHQQAVYDVTNGKHYDVYWSCGNTKRIRVGSLFFLMRLGKEPKGIIGCGYISSAPYLLPHWDKDRAEKGDMTLRTDLLFKALSMEPIISLATLNSNYPHYKWTPQASGMSMPDELAKDLFSIIQGNSKFQFKPNDEDTIKLYVEGKSKNVTYKTYDRSAEARRKCIRHHGYNCSVCGFNFGDGYGELGVSYIEVHHLNQIADAGEEYMINPVEDLRPVCANCHRMLHKTRPPLAIEELRKRLR